MFCKYDLKNSHYSRIVYHTGLNGVLAKLWVRAVVESTMTTAPATKAALATAAEVDSAVAMVATVPMVQQKTVAVMEQTTINQQTVAEMVVMLGQRWKQ